VFGALVAAPGRLDTLGLGPGQADDVSTPSWSRMAAWTWATDPDASTAHTSHTPATAGMEEMSWWVRSGRPVAFAGRCHRREPWGRGDRSHRRSDPPIRVAAPGRPLHWPTVKRLWLLRHAKSSWDDPGLPDPDRPLAPRGRRAAELLAAHLATSDVRPAVVLCSSSLRTRQTLAAVLPALGDALEIRIERALYGAGAAELLDRLRQLPNRASSAMLVAHNPGVQDLALALTAGGPAPAGLGEKFPTGALATVELDVERWRDLDHGMATATSLVTPRSLEPGPGG
jgi:phosphohistidine phosphatase